MTRFAPLRDERHPSQRVCREVSFVYCPIEQVAQDAKVAVDRCIGNLFCFVAFGPVVPDQDFVDASDWDFSEVRQKDLEPVEMVWLRRRFGEESRRNFAEGHLRL